jgi:hypothetical protein
MTRLNILQEQERGWNGNAQHVVINGQQRGISASMAKAALVVQIRLSFLE